MSLIDEIAKIINIDDLPAEVVKQIVAHEKNCKMVEDDKEDMDEDD